MLGELPTRRILIGCGKAESCASRLLGSTTLVVRQYFKAQLRLVEKICYRWVHSAPNQYLILHLNRMSTSL